MARDKLRLNAAALQIPIGLEDQHAVSCPGDTEGKCTSGYRSLHNILFEIPYCTHTLC